MDTDTNTQNVDAPLAPLSEGARLVLADLRAKLKTNEEEKKVIQDRHTEELAPILARHAKELAPVLATDELTKTLINGLNQLYPQQVTVKDIDPLKVETQTDKTQDANDKFDEVRQPATKVERDEIADGKPKVRITLRFAILSAIKSLNEFSTTSEVVEYINTHLAEEGFTMVQIVTGLRDARRVADIIGIPILTQGNSTYLHGIKEFLNDPADIDSVKEEYFDKLIQKMDRLAYSFKKAETLVGTIVPKHKFYGGPNMIPFETKLPPVSAGGNTESETNNGEKASGDAPGNEVGLISQTTLHNSY